MTTKNLLLGGLSLLLFLSSCKKEIDELPPATQTGAMTFGAKIDGKNWAPAKFGVVPANNLLEAFWSSTESIIITARNFSAEPTETIFELQIGGLNDHQSVYPLNQTFSKPSHVGYGYFIKRMINPVDEWQTSSENVGSVTITHWDKVNRILSGNFEFKAGSTFTSGQSINITDGRFDVKYQ